MQSFCFWIYSKKENSFHLVVGVVFYCRATAVNNRWSTRKERRRFDGQEHGPRKWFRRFWIISSSSVDTLRHVDRPRRFGRCTCCCCCASGGRDRDSCCSGSNWIAANCWFGLRCTRRRTGRSGRSRQTEFFAKKPVHVVITQLYASVTSSWRARCRRDCLIFLPTLSRTRDGRLWQTGRHF